VADAETVSLQTEMTHRLRWAKPISEFTRNPIRFLFYVLLRHTFQSPPKANTNSMTCISNHRPAAIFASIPILQTLLTHCWVVRP